MKYRLIFVIFLSLMSNNIFADYCPKIENIKYKADVFYSPGKWRDVRYYLEPSFLLRSHYNKAYNIGDAGDKIVTFKSVSINPGEIICYYISNLGVTIALKKEAAAKPVVDTTEGSAWHKTCLTNDAHWGCTPLNEGDCSECEFLFN